MRALPAVGLVMILAGLGAYYTTDQLSLFSIANLVVGPLLLLAALIVQSRRVQGFSGAQSRSVVVRWIGILVATAVAVVALVVLTRGWDARLDLTVAGSYTLSEQSDGVCEDLEKLPETERVEFYFFEDSLLARDVRLLVRAYEAHCERIEVHEVSYRDAPPKASAIFGNFSTTVVACRAERCEAVGYPSEENLTNSLLRLVRSGETTLAYFVVGHGEVDLADSSDAGFSGLSEALRNEGITLRALVGPSHEVIPEGADVLVLAGPERDFLAAEIDALDRYLQSGGRMLALLEPGMNTNLNDLLERWGFGLPDGVVADTATSPLLREPRPVTLLAHLFAPYHPITRRMSARTMVLTPGARPVHARRKPRPDDKIEGLVFASRRAWLDKDVAGALAGRTIQQDPGEPSGQEISIAAAGRYPREAGEARIVVIGDRDFASNRLLPALYGEDLLMNSVLWLVEDDSQIAIRPKVWTPDQDPPTLQQTVAYFYFMAFALPEALLLLGIRAWFRQRT